MKEFNTLIENTFASRNNNNQISAQDLISLVETLLDEEGMAQKGTKHEKAIAAYMNSYFNSLEMPITAIAQGGSSNAKDVIVVDDENGSILDSYEVKTSSGTRVDFGQFRISYDGNSWQQATGKNNPVVKKIFGEIKSTLDSQVINNSKVGGSFPAGPSLNHEQALEFWEAYQGRERIKSTSGDIIQVEVSKNLIQDYYSHKGDKYMICGKDVFSLDEGISSVPSLTSKLVKAYVVFRIKYHSTDDDTGIRKNSYTVALRGMFNNSSSTDIENIIEKIYPPIEK